MALSPNYGWSEPDNASLVKDGAQAMRTLGDAIDTSLWNVGYGQAGKNKLINGNFDIWQRGTSFTSVGFGAYSADRWSATTVGTTINLTATQDSSVPNTRSKYSLKFQQVTTGATALTEYAIRQAIEQTNLMPILGRSCTVSFWYRSNKTGSHGIRIIGVNTGGTDQATTFTVNAANTWEYKTLAVTAFAAVSAANLSPTAAAGYVDIGFRVGGTGAGFTTLSANDYFQVSQVQLEAGSTATPFQTASGGSPQAELAMCQRYFQRLINGADATNESLIIGQVYSTTAALAPLQWLVPMRSTPTMTISSAAHFAILNSSGSDVTMSSLSLTSSGTTSRHGRIDIGVSAGLTAGNAGFVRSISASSTLDISAEL